ncbi:hypothetical protein [Paraliomyxa miuraensis]|uniref:hypothetical protein n=1 Tax=Paraliomyxa miuraensis TaxID=376150 RepID=UPI00225A9F73|nr:hypothetical protein [Paraliomyxa miuraensis]MCX4247602.1 O-antigen ligase family protein [Paraliomyxa miuraensis]
MAEPNDDDDERALARREGASMTAREGASVETADPYERQYMKGEGLVLYRDKQRAPWIMSALIGAGALGILVPLVLGQPGAWLGALIGLPIFFLVWMLFAVLRVTVSQGKVQVQYGLFGPTIPISAIESVAPTEYRWTAFGGWGIRRGPDGSWLYNMPGDQGRAVRIEWRDAKGRRRVTLVGSKHNVELAKTIEQARRALPSGAARDALPPGEDDDA